MTYNVFGGTLNLALSIYLFIFWACISATPNFIIINPYFWPGVTVPVLYLPNSGGAADCFRDLRWEYAVGIKDLIP